MASFVGLPLPDFNATRVVKIIDEYTVVINIGSDDGVKAGDKFEIYDPGVEVIDPYSNRSLGRLEFVKATISVTQVYPKMAACKNVKTTGLLDGIDIDVGKPRELRVATTEISGGYDRTIRIGDTVRPMDIAPVSNQ